MKNDQRNWIKAYIIDVLPCISIALYVLAYIYNISFFSVFNLNIDQYLSFSEMLLSIIETLVLFVLFSVIIIWGELWWFTYQVPYVIVIDAERRKKEKEEKKWRIKYKYLRLIIKAKNSVFFSILRKINNWNKKKSAQIDQKINKRKDALKKEEDYHSWNTFTTFLCNIVFSYFLYTSLIKKGFIDKGMMGASIGLAIPLLIFVTFSILDSDIALITHKYDKSRMKKYSTIEIMEIIILYFSFAITIFYFSGKEYGKYVKEHDIATFEIKLNDGRILNNSQYRYINIMNDKIFIIEKTSKNNVIINKESTVSVKIQFKNYNSNSILVEVMDYFVLKTNSLFDSIEKFSKNLNRSDST